MNIPDSGWIAVLRKAEWWVLAAVTTAAAVVLALAHFKAPWFGQLSTTAAIVTGCVGVLAFFLLVFKGIDRTLKAFRKRRIGRVRRKPSELSQRQVEFLVKIYKSGSRDFELPDGFRSPRWLEELKNWNYIKWHSPLVWTPGTPDYYSITEGGWRELEKWHGKSC